MSSLTKGTVRVQVRKDTASNWTSVDPTLAAGEFGFETDTNLLKIGTGSAAWTALNYLGQIQIRDTDGDAIFVDHTDYWQINEGTGINVNHTDTSSPTFATEISCDLRGEELGSVLTAGGNATDGHVLTATGSGTAAWEAAGGGGGGGFVLHAASGCRAGNFGTVTDRYYYSSSGINYHYWTANTTTPVNGTHSSGGDYYSERGLIIPSACTMKKLHMTYYTSADDTNTYGMSIWNTTPTYPTSTVADTVYTEVATCSVANIGIYRLNHASNEVLDVSLAAGDILQPYFVRTVGSDSAYIYANFSIWAEAS